MHYKRIIDDFIIDIGKTYNLPEGCIEIDEVEYNEIIDVIKNKPMDTEEVTYKLNKEYEYVETEAEPVEEPDPFENESYAAGYEQALLDLMELEFEEEK